MRQRHTGPIFLFIAAAIAVSPLGFAVETGALPYSFAKAPFIPPRIVGDLNTWLSDGGDQVVAVNLTDSVDSNRYYGAIEISENGADNPFVHTDEQCGAAAKESCGVPAR